MATRYGRGGIDLGLRVIGLALGAVAAGAALLLHASMLSHPGRPAFLDLLIAAILFPCASVGTALLFTGAGVFDRIEVASRWRSPEFVPGRRWTDHEWQADEAFAQAAGDSIGDRSSSFSG